MKLRRALMVVASTAAIAPAALMAAPAAFADASASPSPSASATATDTPTATASASASVSPTTSASSTPSSAPSTSASSAPSSSASSAPSSSASSAPSSSASPSPKPSLTACADPNPAKLVSTISGLPGKIVAGSGWHTFTMSVTNPTDNTAHDVSLWAGVGPADPNGNPFSTKQVALQDYNENTKQWENISYDGKYAFGYVGWTDLQAQSRVTVSLRLSIGRNAPIGKGLTVAGGDYLDMQHSCIGSSQILYKIDIVAPGTPTTGSKPVPQSGGQVPLPKSTPSESSTTEVTATATGSLAHTGAPSQLPVIAGASAAAITAGAGAMFLVRRRKAVAKI